MKEKRERKLHEQEPQARARTVRSSGKATEGEMDGLQTEPTGLCAWCGNRKCLISELESIGCQSKTFPMVTDCGSFTPCGGAIPDSSFRNEGFEKIRACRRNRIGFAFWADWRIGIAFIAYELSCKTVIGDNANILDNTGEQEKPKIIKSIYITGSCYYSLSYWGEDRIDIGSERHSISEWLEIGEAIAKANYFTDAHYIEFIKAVHFFAEKKI